MEALEAESNNGNLIESFTEIETGTSKRKRTEIYKAIDFAKKNNAILVIAKIDRLARNVFFVSSLMEMRYYLYSFSRTKN